MPTIDADVAAAVLAESSGLTLAGVPAVPADSTPIDDAARRAPRPWICLCRRRISCSTSGEQIPGEDQVTDDGVSLDGELLDLLAAGR